MKNKTPSLHVAIIGASDKPDRYSHKAMLLLEEHGHITHLVSPRLTSIEGRPVAKDLAQISAQGQSIDTVTLYVAANISSALLEQLRTLKPRRVIFNPGAENPQLAEQLRGQRIECVEGCTLVMLQTGQF